MRLRRVSHLIVSSVLASCGAEEPHRVVTIPPPASASTTAQVELPPSDVMDVVPTDPNARMRFVSLAEIVAALAPPDPNRVALYAFAPGVPAQRVSGPPVDDVCANALRSVCMNPRDWRWVSIAKDSTITQGTFGDLDRSRTHDAMIARATSEVLNAKASGVWFVVGAPMPFPEARVLTATTKIAPSEDAMAGMASSEQVI